MNILWILSDQHNANCLGHAGHPDVRTPHLDALAKQGSSFRAAYCNNPICGPSRCSMITGQYPWHTGITGNRVRELGLPDGETLPSILRAKGYQTALIGKSHMPSTWDKKGFEVTRYCDLCDADDGDPMNVDYFKFLVSRGLADDYDLGTRFEGQPGFNLERFVSKIPLDACLETWTGNEAVNFLKEQTSEDKPFFLKVSFQRPHEPLCIPEEITDWYDPDTITLPDNASDFFETKFEGKPGFQKEYIQEGDMGYPYRPRDEKDLKGQMANYFTLITLIDQQIGRVLETLKETGQDEDTMIIYTADHGDFAGEHGLMLKNFGLYESIHRVPLILRHPAVPKGSVNHQIVELVDLMPTMLDAAGCDIPKEADGVSLIPIAKGEKPGKASTTCLFDFNERQPCTVAVRTPRYRMVTYPWQEDEIGELYDHQTDPGEVVNLWKKEDADDPRLFLYQDALSSLSQFKRRWSTRDDGHPKFQMHPTPAQLLQQQGKSWSEIRSSDSSEASNM